MKTVLTTLLLLMPLAILKAQSNVPDTNAIYTAVETSPSFPGGEAAFLKYWTKNIDYPIPNKNENINGNLVISFIVEKDGTLSNVKVEQGGWGTLNKNIKTALNKMPKWIPGKQYGKAVRVHHKFRMCINLGEN